MPHLNERTTGRINAALDKRQRELLDDVNRSLENTDNQKYIEIVGRIPADAGDASVGDLIADLNHTMLDRHVNELREIDAARERLRDGTYGQCIDCGGEIGEERLLVNPTAVRCVRCQDAFEKTHAQGATPTL